MSGYRYPEISPVIGKGPRGRHFTVTVTAGITSPEEPLRTVPLTVTWANSADGITAASANIVANFLINKHLDNGVGAEDI